MEHEIQKPWEWIRSEEGVDLTLFKARYDWYRNRRNDQKVKALVLQAPDWVNVVALTPEEHVVIVQQYRFGIQQVTLEIPAGIVEGDETPLQAAKRELKEETGFTSKDWTAMDYVQPNPAFIDNKCHLFLAKDAKKSHPPQLDEGENIRAVTIGKRELKREIESGRLRHSLALVALARVFNVWSLHDYGNQKIPT